jgi:phosphosulfolactate synthase (CoM biosynthesis protein A)
VPELGRAGGFDAVEVSRGVAAMPLDAKRELIKEAAERFVVLAETGVKDAEVVLSTRQWRDEIAEDLAAGATWIITEGRESGTVGIYDGPASRSRTSSTPPSRRPASAGCCSRRRARTSRRGSSTGSARG